MNLTEEIQSGSPQEIADILMKKFMSNLAFDCVIIVQSQITMYIGDREINPKWKLWDEIGGIVYEKLSTEKDLVINHFKIQENA